MDNFAALAYKPPLRNAARPHPGAQVAQLVEQRIENPRVGGSIPPLGTIKDNNILVLLYFFVLGKFLPTSLPTLLFGSAKVIPTGIVRLADLSRFSSSYRRANRAWRSYRDTALSRCRTTQNRVARSGDRKRMHIISPIEETPAFAGVTSTGRMKLGRPRCSAASMKPSSPSSASAQSIDRQSKWEPRANLRPARRTKSPHSRSLTTSCERGSSGP